MTDLDPTAISEFLADLRVRLMAVSKRPTPPSPTKKLLETVDPALREDLRAALEDVRGEEAVLKAVSSAKAKQARTLEKAIVADAARLLKVAARTGK